MSLRAYEPYMADMTDFINHEVERKYKDTDMWPIRDLYRFVKDCGANIRGLRPIKKDRRKLLNRYKKLRIRQAQDSYSESVSRGEAE